MEVTVILKAPAAQAFRGKGKSRAADSVRKTAESLGVELQPLDPTGADPELSRFFRVEVEPQKAPLVVKRFGAAAAVEAAYAKPEDALP